MDGGVTGTVNWMLMIRDVANVGANYELVLGLNPYPSIYL